MTPITNSAVKMRILDIEYSVKAIPTKYALPSAFITIVPSTAGTRTKRSVTIERASGSILKHYSPPGNLFIAAVDCLKAGWFYVLLGPKIVFKKIRRIPLVKENYLGGWYLIKVYFENIMTYRDLVGKKHTDFLADAEIENFERQSAESG